MYNQLLDTFITVADCGSFTKAAEQLYISPTAVMKQMNALEKHLSIQGSRTMVLDGDNIRMGLNRDLGFKEQDRIENIRRIAEVSKLMNDAGLIVLTAFISPYASDRRIARDIIGHDNFIEVYVNTPLEECERRDVKGLYQKARNGLIPNFTGISSKYEEPEHADIVINTSQSTVEESLEQLLQQLSALSVL